MVMLQGHLALGSWGVLLVSFLLAVDSSRPGSIAKEEGRAATSAEEIKALEEGKGIAALGKSVADASAWRKKQLAANEEFFLSSPTPQDLRPLALTDPRLTRRPTEMEQLAIEMRRNTDKSSAVRRVPSTNSVRSEASANSVGSDAWLESIGEMASRKSVESEASTNPMASSAPHRPTSASAHPEQLRDLQAPRPEGPFQEMHSVGGRMPFDKGVRDIPIEDIQLAKMEPPAKKDAFIDNLQVLDSELGPKQKGIIPDAIMTWYTNALRAEKATDLWYNQTHWVRERGATDWLDALLHSLYRSDAEERLVAKTIGWDYQKRGVNPHAAQLRWGGDSEDIDRRVPRIYDRGSLSAEQWAEKVEQWRKADFGNLGNPQMKFSQLTKVHDESTSSAGLQAMKRIAPGAATG